MIRKRRVILVLILFTGLFIFLIGRLVQIQMISAESFSNQNINLLKKSVEQRTYTVVLDDGRGRFVDRNGVSLSEEYHNILILFPVLKQINGAAEKLTKLLHLKEEEFLQQITRTTTPVFFHHNGEVLYLTDEQMEAVNRLGIPGIVAAPVRASDENNVAQHVIGLTGQNVVELKKRYKNKAEEGLPLSTPIGISGLQLAFDEFLLTDGESKLLYHVDRHGVPMFEKKVKFTYPSNPYYPVVVVTTLEKDLQKMAENLVNESGMEKGGVVLLDVKTNEVLALVSKPALRTETALAYKQGAENHMLIPQFPGSVFKIIVASAAIDKGLVMTNRTFDCDNDPYGEGRAEHPMGMLSFEESFARSCNQAFAQLGRELIEKDSNAFEAYTNMLGAAKPVGWKGNMFHFSNFQQLPEEKQGTIWTDVRNKSVDKAIAQTSIGQKDVRLSPLAVANMMATIARGGEAKEVKVVRELDYKNGAKLFQFPNHKYGNVHLSSKTIKRMQQLLQSVVTSPNGTGANYRNLPVNIAGKTGTAQTGQGNKVNRWFASYFPYENPRYALVVVDLESDKPNNITNQIVSQYVKQIVKWEKKQNRR